MQTVAKERLIYSKSGGKAFAIPTLTNYHVYVSNPKQIKELNNASQDLLSLNQTLVEVCTAPNTSPSALTLILVESLFPKYTMHGQNIDSADPFNSTVVFALKARLRPALSTLHPRIEQIVAETLQSAESDVADAGSTVPKLLLLNLLMTV